MSRTERVTSMQDVYDLIIATCQYNAEFHAWGASALRYLNAIADTHPKGGDVKQAPLVSGGGAATQQSPKNPINTVSKAA